MFDLWSLPLTGSVIILLSLSGVSTEMCYVCTGDDCSDPYTSPASHLTNCTALYGNSITETNHTTLTKSSLDYCTKVIITHSESVPVVAMNSGTATSRSYSTERHCGKPRHLDYFEDAQTDTCYEPFSKSNYPYKTTWDYCVCKGDACNSAPTNHRSHITSLIVPLLMFYMIASLVINR